MRETKSALAQLPSLHQHYPASIHLIGSQASTVLCSCPTPLESFSSLTFSACRAYSGDHDWLSRDSQELKGLTGCLIDIVCSENGPRTPGLRLQLAVNAAKDIAFRHAQTWDRIQQLQSFRSYIRSPPQSHPRSVHPHYLSVYASRYDFDPRVLYASCNTRYRARG